MIKIIGRTHRINDILYRTYNRKIELYVLDKKDIERELRIQFQIEPENLEIRYIDHDLIELEFKRYGEIHYYDFNLAKVDEGNKIEYYLDIPLSLEEKKPVPLI